MARTLALTLVVALQVATLAPTAEAGPAATADLGSVPLLLDSSNQAGWWKPIDVDGDTVVVSFNRHVPPSAGTPANTTHEVVVGVQHAGGPWSFGCVADPSRPSGCAAYIDDCGHNAPTVVVDGDGYVHAFVSMHNSAWHYFRSANPWDATQMVDRSAELPDQGGLMTYPVAARTPNGDVYLAVRARLPSDTVFGGRLHHWDLATRTWSAVGTFARQPKQWVYPDDLVTDHAGNVHLVYQWSYGSARAVRHFGSYLRYTPSTGSFTNLAGAEVAVPTTTASRTVYQPLEQGESAVGWRPTAAGVQSAKLAVVPGTTTPMIAYRYRRIDGGSFEVRRARPVGGRWVREVVYAGRYDTHAAVDITHDGSVVRVYYAKKNYRTVDQAFAAEKGMSGGFTEHSVAPGRTVERLAVTMDDQGTDHLYLFDAVDAPRSRTDPRQSEDPPCHGGSPAVLLVGTMPR
jgi:hypothetical protein